MFGSFPWEDYRAAALASADAFRSLHWKQIPIVGGQPIVWGGRRLVVREKLGVLLLLGMCWAAREDAIEGTVWPHVRDSEALRWFGLGGLDSDILFQPNGMGGLGAAPTQLTKDLIEGAVRTLGLRHALDCRGVHRWVLTLNLQFGIPVRAFRAGGMDWLRGAGRPQAIEYLLGEQTLGDRSISSDSFQRTWRSLRTFVRGRRGFRETCDDLRAHRWASGTDWEEMLREVQSGRVAVEVPEDDTRPPLSRSDPCLLLGPDGRPSWLVGLSIPTEDSSALVHDRLRLLVAGRQVGFIDRQEEDDRWAGSFSAPDHDAVAGGFDVWVGFRQALDPWAEIQASAVDSLEPQFVFPISEDQQTRAHEPMLFARCGDTAWVPCRHASTGSQYLLALPASLRDADPSWPDVSGAGGFGDPSAGWTFRVLQSTGAPLELRCGEDVAWAFGVAAVNPAFRPVLSQQIRNDGDLRLLVDGPAGAVIDSALDEDSSRPFRCDGSSCLIPLSAFEPDATSVDPRSTIPIRLSIRCHGQRRVIRRQVEYPRPHLVVGTATGTRRHRSSETLYVGDFHAPRLVGLREAGGSMTPFVFEGAAPRTRAALLAKPSGRLNSLTLLGQGSPIELLGDLVNLTAAGKRHRLAARAINIGALATDAPLIDDSVSSLLRFRLARPGLVPDGSWTLEILLKDGREISATDFQSVSADDDWLPVKLPTTVSAGDIVAMRLVVGSRVRGRWEHEAAVAAIDPLVDDRSRWLTMLLWELQPPDRESECWEGFLRLFRSDPSAVLTPPDDLPLVPSPRPIADLDDRHAALVDQLVDRLNGGADEAAIVDAIAPGPPAESPVTSSAADELARRLIAAIRYSPFFAAVLMNAIDADSRGAIDPSKIRRRRTAICQSILAVGNGIEPTVDALIERAVGPGSVLAGAGGIDSQFVVESIREAKRSIQAGLPRCAAALNLKILCGMTRREGVLPRAVAAELISP